MDKKIVLIYENNEYNIYMEGKLIFTEKDINNAFENFKEKVEESKNIIANNWNSILSSIVHINNDSLNIDNEYKTLTFKKMKYFHSTGKVFYTYNNQLIPLTGGIYTFNSILNMISENYIFNYEEVLDFFVDVLKKKATVRIIDSNIIVGSAIFHYGSAEYNFVSKKINKGATIETGDFNKFKSYVLDLLN